MRISDWSSDVCSSDLDGPKAVRDYLRLKLMAERHEVFVAVFHNSQHQVLACEPLFKGTVSAASVYPRLVVQRALELNASALIFYHQLQSGTHSPSFADLPTTTRFKFTLELVVFLAVVHL